MRRRPRCPVSGRCQERAHMSVFGHLIDLAPPARRWASLVRNGFGALALVTDVVAILAMATITGAIYHAFVYGAVDSTISFFEVGAVAAGIFVLPNIFRGEYALPN